MFCSFRMCHISKLVTFLLLYWENNLGMLVVSNKFESTFSGKLKFQSCQQIFSPLMRSSVRHWLNNCIPERLSDVLAEDIFLEVPQHFLASFHKRNRKKFHRKTSLYVFIWKTVVGWLHPIVTYTKVLQKPSLLSCVVTHKIISELFSAWEKVSLMPCGWVKPYEMTVSSLKLLCWISKVLEPRVLRKQSSICQVLFHPWQQGPTRMRM